MSEQIVCAAEVLVGRCAFESSQGVRLADIAAVADTATARETNPCLA
jgi:hypothetical protein